MAARLGPCANLYIKRVSKENVKVDHLKSCPDFLSSGMHRCSTPASLTPSTRGFPSRDESQCSLGKWWRGGWVVGLMHKVSPPLSYPALCFSFFFFKPLPWIPTPFGFFGVGSSTWACSGGLIFLVSHLLNHVGVWDLLLVPHWWKKIYIVVPPNLN